MSVSISKQGAVVANSPPHGLCTPFLVPAALCYPGSSLLSGKPSSVSVTPLPLFPLLLGFYLGWLRPRKRPLEEVSPPGSIATGWASRKG